MSSHGSSTDQPDPRRYEGLLPRRGQPQEPQGPSAEDQPREVDQVAIRKLGGFNFLDVNQWAALSRDDRMKLIKAGAVLFLFQGEEVPIKPALLYFKLIGEQTAATRQEAYPPAGREGLDFGSA